MTQEIHNGILLDEHAEITLIDLCGACSSSESWIIELVAEGALEPINWQETGSQHTQWLFTADSLQRVGTAKRLHRDLQINVAGIALALNLLDQIDALEARLQRLGFSNDI